MWGSTLRELVREVAMTRDRTKREYDKEIRQAWWVVRIYVEARTKRLPSLQSLITPTKPRRHQSVDEMIAVVEGLARQYGGKLQHAQ